MVERILNAIIASILGCIVLGAIYLQFFDHQKPCPLCYLQRLAMFGVASGLLMNVKFGPQKRNYGLSLLFCLYGGFVALRQMAFHACPDFPTFGTPFWGLSLYTWSFITFSCSMMAIALLLFGFNREKPPEKFRFFPWWGWVAFSIVSFDIVVNVVAVAIQCGIGAC